MSVDPDAERLLARVKELERENARLLQQVAQQRALAEAGRVATIAVLERLDLRDVLNTLLDSLAALVPFDAACVMLLDGRGRAVVEAGVGYPVALSPGALAFHVEERSHLDDLVRTMRSVYVPDTLRHEGWQHGVAISSGTRSWLGVPLIARGQVLGLFAIDKRLPNDVTAADVSLAEALAVHAALAIANARLMAELS